MYFRPENSIESTEPEMIVDPFFIRLLARMKKFRRLMSCVFFSVIGLTLLYVWLAPRKYTSHMKILVTNDRPGLMLTPTGGDEPSLPGDAEIKINSEVELLRNTDLLRRVVFDCSLANLSSVRSSMGSVECSPANTAPNHLTTNSTDEKKIERAVEKLNHDLSVESLRKTNLIAISYSSRDPNLTVNVLDSLASAYLTEHLKVHGSTEPYEVFTQEREASAQRLEQARLALSTFQQEHPSTIGEQQDSLVHEKFDTEAQLRDATKALLENRAREQYAKKITSNHSMPKSIITQTRSVPNLYSIQQLNTMLVDLENRRTELLNKYNPGDRLVVQVEKQIDTTQAALASAKADQGQEQLTDRNPVYADAQMEGAQARINVAGLEERQRFLIHQEQDDDARLVELKIAQTRLTELQQEVAEAQEIDDIYRKKQSESQVTESLDKGKIADVEVVERPMVTYIPSSPEVGLDISVGVFAAIIAAIGSVFLAELFSSARHSVERLP